MKRFLLVTVSLIALLVASAAVFATPPQPTAGTAVVDGNYGEWNLVTDFFANMYRAGNPNKPLESKLYIRYDCTTHVVYALCLKAGTDPIIADPNPEQNWIAINTQSNKVVTGLSGNDGIPPDFEFINVVVPTPPDSLTFADGWEASFPLGEGSYTLIGHAEVLGDFLAQTSATTGFPGTGPALTLACEPIPIEPSTWGKIKSLYR
jgi:hypothetical protein